MTTPQLHYFRSTPPELSTRPPLASSLQSFETMLFMLALRRHPGAVISCQAAIESALKSHLRSKPDSAINVASAVTTLASQGKHRLAEFTRFRILDFTNLRNDFAHYGYSPKDDNRAITQLMGTGLPLLLALYADLFDLFLDPLAIRPDATSLSALTPAEQEKVALIPEFGNQVRIALDVFALAKVEPGIDLSYCIHALAYHVGRSVVGSFLSGAETDLLFGNRRLDHTFDNVHEVTAQLERMFSDSWRFDCPICQDGVGSFVCEIIDRPEKPHGFSVRRAGCPCCGFSIPADHKHLADVLLAPQFPAAAPKIAAGN